MKEKSTGALLGFGTLGDSMTDVRDVTCKRNNGIMRASVPSVSEEIEIYLVGSEKIYRTTKMLVPWDKEKTEGETPQDEKNSEAKAE